jgi:hypothetical protein
MSAEVHPYEILKKIKNKKKIITPTIERSLHRSSDKEVEDFKKKLYILTCTVLSNHL